VGPGSAVADRRGRRLGLNLIRTLRRGGSHDLAVLAEAQRFLDYLYRHGSVAAGLRVPDGSRAILDEQGKQARRD
jgi:hypothetical protein